MRAISEIVDKMVVRLAAAEWLPTAGPAEPAFEEVKRFGWPELDRAFEYLYVTKQRVALVLFLDTQFQNSRQGGKFLVRRSARLQVICSDRVLGNVDQATWGVADTHPGAVRLSQIAVDTLSGRLFTGLAEANDTALSPESETFLTLEQEGRTPGRVAVAVEFKAVGAYDSAELGSDFNG